MSSPVVWFDFGGVLTPPLSDLFVDYHTKSGISPRQMQRAIEVVGAELGAPALAPIELGHLSEAEWGRRLRRVLAAEYPGLDLSRARLETFGEQWFEGVTLNPAMARAVTAVSESGLEVGILSNNVVEWESHWRRLVEPLGSVRYVVDSCRVGARKPDPAIFRVAERVAGVAPTDCVLLDDLAENCRAAVDRGWRAVHFRGDEQALAELADLLDLPTLALSLTTSPEAR